MQSIVITGKTTTGGAATEVTIDNAPPISAILAADLIVALHDHVSAVILATETAADSITFVGLADGTGADTAANVSHAGGAGANISVPTDATKALRTALTIVTTTPDADGEIQLTDVNKFNLYLTTELTVDDVIILQARITGEIMRP